MNYAGSIIARRTTFSYRIFRSANPGNMK